MEADPQLLTTIFLESGVKHRVLGSSPTGISALTVRLTASTRVTEPLSGLIAATTLPSGETATNEADIGLPRIGLRVGSGVVLDGIDLVTGNDVGSTTTVVTATTLTASAG
jgi:hypothetical protein